VTAVALAIVDAGGANLASVCAAFERLGATPLVTSDPAVIASAERVVLPGVGAAAPAMARLVERGLADTIVSLRQPVLGICIGMQVLYEASDEGDVRCLGVLPGRVRALARERCGRVPHMGWNRLEPRGDSPLLEGLDASAYAYFVHSYAAAEDARTVAGCRYGDTFAAVVSERNFHAVQFHPERSGAVGARVLANWLALA